MKPGNNLMSTPYLHTDSHILASVLHTDYYILATVLHTNFYIMLLRQAHEVLSTCIFFVQRSIFVLTDFTYASLHFIVRVLLI